MLRTSLLPDTATASTPAPQPGRRWWSRSARDSRLPDSGSSARSCAKMATARCCTAAVRCTCTQATRRRETRMATVSTGTGRWRCPDGQARGRRPPGSGCGRRITAGPRRSRGASPRGFRLQLAVVPELELGERKLGIGGDNLAVRRAAHCRSDDCPVVLDAVGDAVGVQILVVKRASSDGAGLEVSQDGLRIAGGEEFVSEHGRGVGGVLEGGDRDAVEVPRVPLVEREGRLLRIAAAVAVRVRGARLDEVADGATACGVRAVEADPADVLAPGVAGEDSRRRARGYDVVVRDVHAPRTGSSPAARVRRAGEVDPAGILRPGVAGEVSGAVVLHSPVPRRPATAAVVEAGEVDPADVL